MLSAGSGASRRILTLQGTIRHLGNTGRIAEERMTSRTRLRARAYFATISVRQSPSVFYWTATPYGRRHRSLARTIRLAGPMNELEKALQVKRRTKALPSISPASVGVARKQAGRTHPSRAGDLRCFCAVVSGGRRRSAEQKRHGAGTWFSPPTKLVVITTQQAIRSAFGRFPIWPSPALNLCRITGEKTTSVTNRTIVFLKKAAARRRQTVELAQKIVRIRPSAIRPSRPRCPTLYAPVQGRQARMPVSVYVISAAVAARNDIDIIRFPASVNVERRDRVMPPACPQRPPKNPKDSDRFRLDGLS